MVYFSIALITLLIGIIAGICMHSYSKTFAPRGGEKTTSYPLRKFFVLPIVLGVLFSGVFVFISCTATVPTGHTGVLTTFGKVEDQTLDAGFNTKLPWQSVVNMDNRVQKATSTLYCFSSDIQEVTVAYTLNYQINKSNAQNLYKTVGVTYYDTVILPNIAEAVKVVTARYTAEQLVSSRAELATAIEDVLTTQLESYNIELVSAAIEDMDFTDAFTNAVEAKQVAAQNKLQAEIEQQQKVMEQEAAAKIAKIQAEAEAEAAKIKAEADAEVAKIKAQAELEVEKTQADAKKYAGEKEAEANKAISESLTDELLQYQYIQQWDGKLPETYVGSEDVSTIINGAGAKANAN